MSSVTAVSRDEADTILPTSYRLVLVFGPSQVGQARIATDRPEAIGRIGHVQGPFALEDDEVSRNHAVVVAHPEGVSVRDLGSRNGTFVNGVRVTEAVLGDGDVLRTGATLFVVERISGVLPVLTGDGELRGQSFAISRARQELAQAALHDAPVLILGESGVGKELAARELHQRSGRAGPLVTVNCGALPEQLAESELFGHVKGAFTGADQDKEGLFHAATGGTLFLDEVGETPPMLQAKLLRALADGEVRPVGSIRPRRVDVRVVAATNRSLEQAVAANAFRADLFSRLRAWTVELPPLRARRADILLLAAHFGDGREPAETFSRAAAEALLLYDWPYNVRELRQVITVARAKTPDPAPIGLDALANLAPSAGRVGEQVASAADDGTTEASVGTSTPTADELRAALEECQGDTSKVALRFQRDRSQIYRWARRYGLAPEAFRVPTKERLAELMAAQRGNIARVAEHLGVSRRQLYRWLEKHGLRPEDYRDA